VSEERKASQRLFSGILCDSFALLAFLAVEIAFRNSNWSTLCFAPKVNRPYGPRDHTIFPFPPNPTFCYDPAINTSPYPLTIDH
jgi:hypothetical protein